MGRTFIRQDVQIANSDVYDDTIAPSIANFETNPGNIEDDFNNVRSQLSNLIDVQVNDWYTDLLVPSALDTGAKRGVNNLNTDLHALERKRVLVKAVSLASVAIAAAVAAAETLTLTGQPLNTETVTIGSKVYTFQTSLTNVDGNVLIGATPSDSLDNLIAAINLAAGAGSLYAAATTANADVSAVAGAGDTMDVTALKAGTAGNSIASTETLTNGSWGGATLSGGSGGDVVILGSGELPPNTTAAVGAVTTTGTVVSAAVTTLGVASLNEVAGSNAIAPKNFVEVVDSTSRDPILSDGRVVYGLLQGEPGLADGDTILDAASDRVQVTFVRINAAGNDLETIDGTDLGSNSVFLCFTERKALEDLTEQDFLRGAVTDVPTSSTVTRQAGYDNQGTTAVEVTTNSDLDLNGAGIDWGIRDLLNADLFRITEGSTGGTSDVQIAPAVDTFSVDAVVNSFTNGASFDDASAGTTIDIGVTAANTITSGGDLNIDATSLLAFGDGFEAGSTYGTPLVLSDSSAEWSAFETQFGEVSLLAAITAAGASSTQRDKKVAVANANAAADTDVGGSGGGSNLDAQLCDYSGVTFLTDVDVFLNGVLLRNGADASANHDVYPGTSAALGQIKFEFPIKGTGTKPDQITMICWG